MDILTVAFDIPPQIAQGLANQTLERVGGVIRNAQTKEVVAWLRESSNGSITQAPPLLNIGTTASILNLGVSVIGFTIVIEKLHDLELQLKDIQQVLNKINRKIDISFSANFRSALTLANNAFQIQNIESRRNYTLSAINKLLDAEHIYTDLVDQELAEQSPAINEFLQLLILAYVAEARCHLELEEMPMALQSIQKGLQNLRPRIEEYIRILLTSCPAIYLHPELQVVDLQRLTRIYRWLDPSLNESLVFEKLRYKFFKLYRDTDEWHTDKWTKKLPPAIFMKNQVELELKSAFKYWANVRDAAFQSLAVAISKMESMIEDFNRIESFQYEMKVIEKLGITYQDWLSLDSNEVQPEMKGLKFITMSQPLTL